MWWLIGLYIIPGMITTWLMPKIVEYNGGQDFLKHSIEGYEEDY